VSDQINIGRKKWWFSDKQTFATVLGDKYISSTQAWKDAADLKEYKERTFTNIEEVEQNMIPILQELLDKEKK
jgi:hypothetical protein